MKNRSVVSFLILCLPVLTLAQKKELKFALNEDGSHYFKFTGLSQVWLRYNESNPGTAIYADPASTTWDIGIRRLRFQAFGQLSDRIFVYTQFGQNNLNHMASRKTGAFFHDAIVEYAVVKRNLSMGAGMTGWSGLGRYASPSVGTILSLDAPLFMQATNDVNDIFLRKLSVYAKGKLGKFDYRMALSSPFPVQSATSGIDTSLGAHATFSPRSPKAQIQGYFMYQFMEEESNLTPYTVGSYHGKKDVFTVGAGFIFQPAATRNILLPGDTSSPTIIQTNTMLLLNVDVFYEHPLNKEKETALTLFASFSRYDFGPGYLRYVGVMNPANALLAGNFQKGNHGNGFPMVGTGQIFYAQTGYLFKKDLLGNQGSLQPYADVMVANYERLKGTMKLYEAGLNWLINGHSAKMTLGWQNRPVFNPDTEGNLTEQGRKNMVVLQYQIGI